MSHILVTLLEYIVSWLLVIRQAPFYVHQMALTGKAWKLVWAQYQVRIIIAASFLSHGHQALLSIFKSTVILTNFNRTTRFPTLGFGVSIAVDECVDQSDLSNALLPTVGSPFSCARKYKGKVRWGGRAVFALRLVGIRLGIDGVNPLLRYYQGMLISPSHSPP